MVRESDRDRRRKADKAGPSHTQRLPLAEDALSLTSDGVLTVDSEGRLVFINEVGRQLLQRPIEPALPVEEQSAMFKLRYPDGHPVPPEETPLGRARRGEFVNDVQLILGKPDGSEVYLSCTARPVRDAQGHIVGANAVFRDITQQRQAEEQYATILRTTMDGFWVTDAQGHFLDANEAYCRRIGYSRDELLAMRVQDIDAAETPEEIARRIQRIRVAGSDRFETRHRCKDGGVIDIELSVTYLERDGGRLFVFARDITERKRAERERERILNETTAQRQLLQSILDNAPAAIILLRGPDFVYELANAAGQAKFPGRFVLGKSLAEAFPELVSSDLLRALEHVWRTGEPFHCAEERAIMRRTPEGPLEEFDFTYDIVPIHGVDGQADAFLFLGLETTEQVKARRQIEELAEVAQRRAAELQGVLDNMVDAVLVADALGRITLVNAAGLRLFGLTDVAEIEHSLAELPERLQLRRLDGTPVRYEELPLIRALAGEITTQNAIIHDVQTRKDVYIRASAAPIRDEEGQIVCAVEVARDVTELTELDRLKDQFILVAAHELKTPVTIVKGYTQTLLRGNDSLPPARRRVLDAIDRGADRITRIVEDLLDISRLQLGQLELREELTDLAKLVEEVIDRLSLTTTRHNLRLIKAEPVAIQGDRDRLEQVLVNLLGNAITYSPQGGEVDVAVYIRGREVVVSVRDRGVGIPEGKQSRIFQRFYRAHTGTPYDYGGMGVGLYISHEIIRRHGGRMWFESKEGEGSTFYFSLPLAVHPDRPGLHLHDQP
ncbi:MAG: PAS domain S-box protein [Chloroflexota bacterium]|nr:MAG: PAS domain S-box protein [Chloroflexota bacterium]